MGRIGRTFSSVDRLSGLNSEAAFRRFTEPGVVLDDRTLHIELIAALIVVVGSLAFVVWLFSL